MVRTAAPLAAALLLGACTRHAETPAVDSGAGVDSSASADPAAALPTRIPDGMLGRWGLVGADCTGPASEAKGLMRVAPRSLDFYEAHGLLGAVSSGDATHLHARFAMTGEGMHWTREQTLELRGDVLVRREFGKDALPQPLTYHRCH